MQSCIYEGRVSHTRLQPVTHRFQYRMFMLYLDLDELPGLFKKYRLWSASRPAPARFRRERHLGQGDLKQAVLDRVEAELGSRPAGPVRLLTNISYFGYGFNPVSFYYCFDADDAEIEAIVVEVNNTPWGEQHAYVRRCENSSRAGRGWRFEVEKAMHVSPFMPMDVRYKWVLTSPGDQLSVYMANVVDGSRTFKASLLLRRREISSTALASVLLRYPLQAVHVVFAIHWQAVRLWLKRVPVYAHPDKTAMATRQS